MQIHELLGLWYKLLFKKSYLFSMDESFNVINAVYIDLHIINNLLQSDL